MDLKIIGCRSLARLTFVSCIGLSLLIIASCAGESRKTQASAVADSSSHGHNANATDGSPQLSFGAETGSGAFDADSWRTLVSQECQFFFDGCNNCRRAPGAAQAACTRKACAEYLQPRCLDEPVPAETAAKKTRYTCDDNAHFSIFIGEYRVDDQRMRLREGEIMLADAQTHQAQKLVRKESASGAKYSGDNTVFWQHGEEAMLTVDGQKLYQNCRSGS